MAKKKSSKNENITQTGHLTYRDLQELNNQNQFGYSSNYQQLLSNERINTVKNLSDWGTTPVRSNTYIQSGGKDYFGRSKYDPDIATENEFEDLNETRAFNQGWLDAIGNGVAKMVGKAGTTIAGTVGLVQGVGGVIGSVFDGEPGVKWSKIWNNSTFDALDKIDKDLESAFTVYSSRAEQDAKWLSLEYLTSKKFWADSVITNIGFTIGAMATGAGSAGLIGKGVSLFRDAAEIGKIGQGAVQLISSAIAASGEAAIEAKEGYNQFKEGRGQELQASVSSYLNNATTALQDKYTPLVNKAREEYEKSKGSLTKTADGSYKDLAYEKYKSTIASLQNDYKKELSGYQAIANDRLTKGMANIEQEAKSVGNKIMAFNQGLLTLGNVIQFGKAFSKSFNNAAQIEAGINKMAEKDAIKTTTKEAIKRAQQTTARNAATVGEQVGETAAKTGEKALIEGAESTVEKPIMGKTRAALKGIVTEGSEEMNQQWISSGAQAYHRSQYADVNDYWNDKYNKDAKDWDFTRTLAAVAQGAKDSWGDFDQYEQFLVGAMMGGAGMPVLNKAGKSDTKKAWYNPSRWFSWEGGVYGGLKEYNAMWGESVGPNGRKGAAIEANEALNTLLQDPKLQTTLKGIADRANHLTVLNKIQRAQEEALERGDKKDYKDQEDKFLAHTINVFARAGRLDDLRAMYSYYADLSDNQIEALIKEGIQNNYVSAEQDKKNFTAKKMAERKTLMEALTQTQADKKKADESGDTENSEYYAQQIRSYAEAIQDINDAIENYQGKEYYNPNIFVDEKGQRKKDFESTEAAKSYFQKNAESLLSKIDKYEQGVELIQNQFNGKLSDDKEDNLLYLWMREGGSSERFGKMFDTLVNSKHFPKTLTISKVETFTKPDGTTEKVEHKDAESVAKSLGLDKESIVENEDGNYEVKLNTITKDRAGAVLARILGAKENAAFLNKAINESNKGLSKIEDKIQLIKDINTFTEAMQVYSDAMEYWHTLTEYMKNPELIEEKKQEAASNAQSNAKNEALKKEKLNSLVDKIISKQLKVDDVLNDDSVSEENKDRVKNADSIASTYLNMLQSINDNGETEAQIEVAKKMLERVKKEAQSADDLTDLTREEYNSLIQDDGDYSPSDLKLIKQMQLMTQGLSERDAEAIVIDGAKSLLSLAKKAAEEKQKKSKATPKTTGNTVVEGENTGVNDGIDPVIANDGNAFVLGKGSDKKGNYTIIARKERGKGGRTEYTVKYIRINNGVVTEENGYYEVPLTDVRIPSDKYFAGKDMKAPLTFKKGLTKVKVKKFVRTVKNKTEQVGVELATRGWHRDVKNNPPRQDNLFGAYTGNLDDLLGTASGTEASAQTTATPITVYTERDGEKMTRENSHISGMQGKNAQEDMNKSLNLKISTPQYWFHYRDTEAITALNELHESGKVPKDRQFLTMPEYFNWKADALEKSSEPNDIAKAAMYRKKAARAQVLWDFMNENGVFERRNSGTITGKVTFGYSKELDEKLAAIKDNPAPPVILIFDENGNIIGDLTGPNDDTYSKYKEAGIELLYTKGQEVLDNNPEYDSNGIVKIPEVSSTVKQHFIGTPNFTNTNNTLNDIMTVQSSEGTKQAPFKMAVVVGYGPNVKMAMTPGRKVSDKSKEEKAVPLPPNAKSHMGKPYLLIETSDPSTPYLPVSILMPSFTADTYGSSKLGAIIKDHLNKLSDVLASKDSKKLIAWRDKLASLLSFENNKKGNPSLFLNTKDGNLEVSFNQEGVKVSDTLEDYGNKTAEEIEQFIVSLLTNNDKLQYPIAFNINIDYINSTGNFEGSGTDYNHVIGELARTNLPQGASRTINDFISFNSLEEKDGKLVEKKTKRENGKKENPTTVVSKNTAGPKNVGNGYVIPVQLGSTIDWRVCDKDGNIIQETPDNAGQLAATYAKAQEWTEGVHKVPYGNGRWNASFNRFEEFYSANDKVQNAMTSMYSLQDRVHREMTTSTHYYIEDENGEIQEVPRLHAEIDNHFGKAWLNDNRDAIEKSLNDAIEKAINEIEGVGGSVEDRNQKFLSLIKPFSSLIGEDATNKLLADNGYNPKGRNDYKKLFDALKTKGIDVQTGGHSYRALRAGQNYDEQARHFFKNSHVNYNDTSVFSIEQLKEIERGLQAFKDAHPGFKFYTDNLVVTGTLNGKRVAGEVDMIGIDAKGDMYIFDFKTSADPFVVNVNGVNQKSDKFSNIWNPKQQRTTESQYTIQLSSYGNMIDGTYGTETKGIVVVPTQFIYDNKGKGDGVAEVIPQPSIEDMTYHKNVFGLDKDFFNKKTAPKAEPKGKAVDKIKNPTQEQVNAVLSKADSESKSKGGEPLSIPALRQLVIDTFDVTESEVNKLVDGFLKGNSNAGNIASSAITIPVKGVSGTYNQTVEKSPVKLSDLKEGDSFIIMGYDNPNNGAPAIVKSVTSEGYVLEIRGSNTFVKDESKLGSGERKVTLYKIPKASSNIDQKNTIQGQENKPKGFEHTKDAKKAILDKIGKKRQMRDLADTISDISNKDDSIVEALNTLNAMLEDKDNWSTLSSIRTIEGIKNIGKPKLRETDGSTEVIDINKEIAAVRKFIPNVEDATRIVESFIKIGDKEAYGTYINAVMSIARNAARGTLYHESFHYVVDKLMTPQEVTEAFAQARKRWGNKSDIELEELLAEDFREYMQLRESFMGRMKLAWRRLGRMVTSIANNKLYFDNLYRNIRKGKIKKSDNSNILVGNLRQDMQDFLDNFGITINDVSEFGGEVKLFDALNRTINIRTADDITDGVGEAIAFMMQWDSKIREMISVLKTGSKSALVKYNFHKPFRLEISDYLYKYKTNKQQYIQYLGQEISHELRRMYNLEIPTEKDATMWGVISRFFSKMNPFTRFKIRAIRNAVTPIVNNIISNNPKFIVPNYTRPGETKEASLLNVERAFRENPYEADIIKYLGDNGIYLAGSTSIALAGTLYRQDDNPLHDIDFQASSKSKSEIEELLNTKFPAIKLTNTIRGKNRDSTTYTYLVLDRPFVERRDMSNIGVESIFDAKTGEKLGTRSGSNLVLKEGVKGKMLDFFTGSESFGAKYEGMSYNIDGTYYKIADYRGAMTAKVNWKREKDIWDYNRFIPNEIAQSNATKIKQYHHEKLESYNLSKEQIQYLLDKGFTIEEYNNMTDEEKEVALACF